MNKPKTPTAQWFWSALSTDEARRAVLAIEDEAAAQERERLRERWDAHEVIDVVERKGWDAGVKALLAEPE